MPIPIQIPIGCDWEETTESLGGSVSYDGSTTRRQFLTTGTSDITEVIRRCIANIPPTNDIDGVSQFLREYKRTPQGDGTIWTIDADYGNTPDYWEIAGDVGSGTTKTYQAKLISKYDCTGDLRGGNRIAPPDFGRLIGVNGDKVEGVETGVGGLAFAITYRRKNSVMPAGYLQTLYQLSSPWHSNHVTFQIIYKGQILVFGPEELLYMGGPFKTTSQDETEFTYKFQASKSKGGGTSVSVNFNLGAVGIPFNITVESTTGITVGQQIYFFNVDANGITTDSAVCEVINVVDGTTLTIANTAVSSAAVGTVFLGTSGIASIDDDPLLIGSSGPITKRGHHYLWTYSEPRTTPAAGNAPGRRLPRAIAAYVHQPYPTGDLGRLQIGVNLPVLWPGQPDAGGGPPP